MERGVYMRIRVAENSFPVAFAGMVGFHAPVPYVFLGEGEIGHWHCRVGYPSGPMSVPS